MRGNYRKYFHEMLMDRYALPIEETFSLLRQLLDELPRE